MTEKKKKVQVGHMENREMVGDPFGLQRGAKEATTELVELKQTVEEHGLRLTRVEQNVRVLNTKRLNDERVAEPEPEQDFTEYKGIDHQAKMEFALGMADELWEKLEAFCDEHEMRMVLSNLQQKLIDFHLRQKANAEARKTSDGSE